MKKQFIPSIPETPEARNTLRLALGGSIATAIAASFYFFLGWRSGDWQLYGWGADMVALSVIALIAYFQARRGRTTTAAWMLIWGLTLTFLVLVMLIEGTGLMLGVGLGILIAVAVGQTLDAKSAQRAMIVGAAGVIACILLDLYLPPYRLPQPEAVRVFAPGIIGVFALIYGVVIVRNFRNYSLRTKFLLSAFVIAGGALGVFSFFMYQSSNRTVAALTGELQSAIQEQAELQLNAAAEREAGKASEAFAEIETTLQSLVDYRESLFERTNLLGTGSYWDANSLARLAGGQYSNSAKDPGSVFSPASTRLTEAALEELNVSVYLDFIAPSVLKSNPNIVATYFISANGPTLYYPNIDLAAALPPDFNAQDSVFYALAAPKNNPDRKPVWTPPYQDPAGLGLMVTNSIPVYDQSGKFRGVMGADIQLARVADQISGVQAGQSGFAFLIDPEGHILSMTDAGYAFFGLQPENVPFNESPKQTVLGLGPADLQTVTDKMVRGEAGLTKVNMGETEYYISYFPLESVGYSIGLIAPTSELESAYLESRARSEKETEQAGKTVILLFIGILLTAAVVSQILGQMFLRPLSQLRDTAEEIAKGNLDAQARIESKDEVGVLGQTVNSMAAQLRDLIGSLEQRVAERTKALSTVAEVGASASTILETDRLLQEVVDLTKERFDFYHAHIYLLDETGENLTLAAGAGEPGRRMVAEGHSIPLNRERSLVARAARERKGVTVNDVTAAPDFLPNPLLPNTRSELAAPMIVGEQAIGVFDVQSDQVGRFTEADVDVQTTLAAQIAIAIQNARQHDQTQSALAQTEKLFEASRELAQSADMQELTRAAVEAMDIPAIDRAILGLLDYDPNGALKGMTIAANWSNNAELPATPIGTHYSEEALKSVSLFTSKEPLFFDDMLNDERIDETTKGISRKLRYRSVVALPLFVRSRQDALLLLEGEHPHNFTSDEIRLFASLAPQIATVLENRRQFERAQRQAERESMLNAISQKIQGAATIESAMQIAVRELGHALGMKPTSATLTPTMGTARQKNAREAAS